MTWPETYRRILELWPEWEPTESEADLWRDQLGRRDQERVREAVDLAKTESRSWTPNIAAVLAHLRGLAPADPVPGGSSVATLERQSYAAVGDEKRREFLAVFEAAPEPVQKRVRKQWGLGSDPAAWSIGEACLAAGGVDAEGAKP